MQTIAIKLTWEEIERRAARVDAAYHFKYLDRVPVQPGIASRFWLQAFGKTWAEYTSDPRTMLDIQVRAHQWVLENVPGDLTGVGISPDLFSFYGDSYGFGCELGHDDLTPWIRSHPIQDEADLRRLEATDALDNRHTAALRDWITGMEQHLGAYQFRYADGVVKGLPETLSPGIGWGTIGIFTLATDLRGSDIYLDLYERPDFVHEFLRIITDKVLDKYRWLRSLGIGLDSGPYIVDDSSGALSPAHYREFLFPCVMRLVEAIGRPLQIHIDAPANHLLPIYREMNVERLLGFGWGTSPEKVREYLGGHAVLVGNISPALFIHGTPQEVYDASMHVLRVLAPCGGFILTEGANMVPGASLENIQAMVRAADDYGLPE
ncbi:MAG: uroporphyrinogen decarboxylase family protein [Anaerolineae bacterium]